MQKITVNNCWGGFSLSHEAVMLYAKLAGIELYSYVSDGYGADRRYRLYVEGQNDWLIHYSRNPLDENGQPEDEGYFSDREIGRNDPILIEVIEQLSEKANGRYAKLKIVEIPDDVKWVISDYDGMESVEEEHRSWG